MCHLVFFISSFRTQTKRRRAVWSSVLGSKNIQISMSRSVTHTHVCNHHLNHFTDIFYSLTINWNNKPHWEFKAKAFLSALWCLKKSFHIRTHSQQFPTNSSVGFWVKKLIISTDLLYPQPPWWKYCRTLQTLMSSSKTTMRNVHCEKWICGQMK